MRNFSRSEFDFNNHNSVSALDELPLWSAPFGLELLNTIVIKPEMTALDIGFGLGFPLIEIAQRLGRSSRVYGIDPWEAAIERAKMKIDVLGVENVELIQGVAESIPLPDKSVDLIVSNNGINNVQDVQQVFRECSRVAKKGSQFAVTINLPETMIEFYKIFEQVLEDFHLGSLIPALKEHIHKKRMPLDELKELFVKNNFDVAQMNTNSFSYRFTDGTAMFDYPFIKNNFMDSWLEIVPEERVNDVFREIESRMNCVSSHHGQWVLTIPFVTVSAFRK